MQKYRCIRVLLAVMLFKLKQNKTKNTMKQCKDPRIKNRSNKLISTHLNKYPVLIKNNFPGTKLHG